MIRFSKSFIRRTGWTEFSELAQEHYELNKSKDPKWKYEDSMRYTIKHYPEEYQRHLNHVMGDD